MGCKNDKNNKQVKSLCIKIPKMRYVNGFKGTKVMFLLIKDDQLIKTYNGIWDKIRTVILRKKYFIANWSAKKKIWELK